MTTTEDVLLSLNKVRYKKGDGTLYVMKERIAWIAENRDTVTVSHHFSDIKTQKISSEGKPKVQLQVVLLDGNSSTFHFVDEAGTQAQIEARDKVKELLAKLLPNFKRVADEDMTEKRKLLNEDPKLLELYRELVISQIITSSEFWEKYAPEYKKKSKTQAKGVSGAFLADIKPQTDGCNGLKYNLNADVIRSIFKTYPTVKRKHLENVPHKMTEEEFWVKFFQSHYFHRDRLTHYTKDLFSECGKIDDQVLKAAVENSAGDPLYDIKEFVDLPLEEGYGGVRDEPTAVNSGNLVHQSMIKRFNQHSIMVLKTVSFANANDSIANGPMNANPTAASKVGADVETCPANKKQRIMEKITFDDLNESTDTVRATESMFLNKDKKFRERPLIVPNQSTNSLDISRSTRNVDEIQMELIRLTNNWQKETNVTKILSASAAVNALGELSPGGALMRHLHNDSVGQIPTPALYQELRNLFISAKELLTHFWKNIPVITNVQEERLKEIYEALQRFKDVKLAPYEVRAMHELSSLDSPLTDHLRLMLDTAENAYVIAQQKTKPKIK